MSASNIQLKDSKTSSHQHDEQLAQHSAIEPHQTNSLKNAFEVSAKDLVYKSETDLENQQNDEI